MRRQKEVREQVLGRAGTYKEVIGERLHAKDPAPLKVKEAWEGERRYVVFLNEEQRRKDVFDRKAIVDHLREQLKRGEKSLVGQQGLPQISRTLGQGTLRA